MLYEAQLALSGGGAAWPAQLRARRGGKLWYDAGRDRRRPRLGRRRAPNSARHSAKTPRQGHQPRHSTYAPSVSSRSGAHVASKPRPAPAPNRDGRMQASPGAYTRRTWVVRIGRSSRDLVRRSTRGGGLRVDTHGALADSPFMSEAEKHTVDRVLDAVRALLNRGGLDESHVPRRRDRSRCERRHRRLLLRFAGRAPGGRLGATPRAREAAAPALTRSHEPGERLRGRTARTGHDPVRLREPGRHSPADRYLGSALGPSVGRLDEADALLTRSVQLSWRSGCSARTAGDRAEPRLRRPALRGARRRRPGQDHRERRARGSGRARGRHHGAAGRGLPRP